MIESFPSRAYFICADARTGSGLLASTLRRTKLAGKSYEYFVDTEIDQPWMRQELHVPESVPFTGFRDWRNYIVNAGSEFNGVFAATVHWFQFGNVLATFGSGAADAANRPVDVLRAFFPNLRIIWLTRENIVAQAISHYSAIATGVWRKWPGSEASGAAPDHRAPYDFAAIDWQVKSAVVAYDGWRDTFADAAELTLPLTYEQLSADLDGSVRKVFEHLGLSLEGKPVPPALLVKQAGEWSLELERRYRAERAERGMGPVGDEARI